MFESVLLPAPFSPSRACTSPAAASKSTHSFATTSGKRFVIPRMSTAGGAPSAPLPPIDSASCNLALRASDHALHEPVHGVEVLDGKPLARRHPQLARLVVERTLELVERAVLESLLDLRDLGLRLGAHLGPVRRDVREAVLDRPVVEAGLPRVVHRRVHASQVVGAPVVHRRR